VGDRSGRGREILFQDNVLRRSPMAVFPLRVEEHDMDPIRSGLVIEPKVRFAVGKECTSREIDSNQSLCRFWMCDRTNFSSRKSFVHLRTLHRHRSSASFTMAASICFLTTSSISMPPNLITSACPGSMSRLILSCHAFCVIATISPRRKRIYSFWLQFLRQEAVVENVPQNISAAIHAQNHSPTHNKSKTNTPVENTQSSNQALS
jgi:hypothetical protein